MKILWIKELRVNFKRETKITWQIVYENKKNT